MSTLLIHFVSVSQFLQERQHINVEPSSQAVQQCGRIESLSECIGPNDGPLVVV